MHTYLALCPEYVLLKQIPLGQLPSLHPLRNPLMDLVRRLPGYYGVVRLPMTAHHRLVSSDFPMRPPFPCEQRQSWDLPIPVQGVSVRATGSTTAQGPCASRAIDAHRVAFRHVHGVCTLDSRTISRLNTRPTRTPVNASPGPSRAPAHDSGPTWLAMPSSYDSFIHNTPPVFIGAFGRRF